MEDMCYRVFYLLQDLVQSCSRGGGHVLRETTSQGLCGLVCPAVRVELLQYKTVLGCQVICTRL